MLRNLVQSKTCAPDQLMSSHLGHNLKLGRPRALHIFYGKKILLSNFQNKNVWKQAWKTSDSEVHYCYCNNEKLSYTYWWHCIFYTSPIFKSINYHHPAWLSELTNQWDLVFFILCCAWFEPPWFKLPLVQYNLSA